MDGYQKAWAALQLAIKEGDTDPEEFQDAMIGMSQAIHQLVNVANKEVKSRTTHERILQDF